jgi:FAD-dependent urate hydroxylase
MRALVIGGGIGGPVAAIALARIGVEPVVFEARPPADGDHGLFLNMASNGLGVLHQLGINLADADGWPVPRMVMWSGAGKRLAQVANGTGPNQYPTSMCVRRDDLHRILRQQADADGVAWHSEARFTDGEVTPDGATARFADGSAARGDVLVAADGVWSTARRILDPAAPSPAFTGQLSIGGFSRVDDLEPTRDTQHFVFGRRAFFGYLVRDDGWTWWFANTVGVAEAKRQELQARSTGEWIAHLRDLFAGDLPVIDRILAATIGDVGAYPIFDLASVPVWQRDRGVLVGDAVHATSPSAGQGASLAVEDALTLALCLREQPDVREALTRYEALRRRRAERVVRHARRIGNSKTPGPLGRVVRDALLPIVLPRVSSPARLGWLYDHHIPWNAEAER